MKFDCASCGEHKRCMAWIQGPPICKDCFDEAVHITMPDNTVLVKFAKGTTEYMPPGISC